MGMAMPPPIRIHTQFFFLKVKHFTVPIVDLTDDITDS
jgi:hypothetical protein